MTGPHRTGSPVTAEEIRNWLSAQIAGILNRPEAEIDPDDTFDSFGLASRDAVSLSGDLEDYLNRRLSPTLLYQYPTIRQLADHLAPDETRTADKGAVTDRSDQADPAAQEVRTGVTAEMSDEEARARLLQKLLELEE